MPFESGLRDRYVLIESLSTEAAGTSHAPVETWTTLRHEWASKTDIRSRERLINGQMATGFDTRWEFGYSEAMDPEQVDVTKTRRIVYLGRTYDIVGAAMIGRREAIEILTLSSGRVA